MSAIRFFLAACLVTTLFAAPVQAQSESDAERHWPRFRGPDGLGVAAGQKPLPVEFGSATSLIWKTPLAPGHSSPCVWEDRIFLSGVKDGRLETLGIDRRDGKVLWRQMAPAEKLEKVHAIGSPAASTPTTDGRRVYVYFGSFGLLCYDFDGKEQWRHPLPVPATDWGAGSSPIVVGERLLFNSDSDENSFLLALRCDSGEQVWKAQRQLMRRGWSTPLLWRHDGIEELVVLGSGRLVAYDPADGSERWWVGGLPPHPCMSPVVGSGMLFAAIWTPGGEPAEPFTFPDYNSLLKDYDKNKDGSLAPYEIPPELAIYSRGRGDGEGDITVRMMFRFVDVNNDGLLGRFEWLTASLGTKMLPQHALLAIRPGGLKNVTSSHIAWKYGQGLPEVPSPLCYQDRIYLVKNGGILTCLEASSGKQLYQKRLEASGHYYASPVAGDGKIYLPSERGVVTVLKAGDTLEVLAQNDLGERIMATPALVDGTVYVRTEQHLYAFGTKP